MALSNHSDGESGVFVFRTRRSKTERRRWLIAFGSVMVVLNAAAALIWDGTGPSETSRGDIARVLFVLSWCPAFLAVMCAVVPEALVRISPRGIWHATTRWGVIPGRTRRWRLRWDEITALKWQGARSAFRKDGEKRSIDFSGWNPPKSPPISVALHIYLSRRFDLSDGTVNQRLSRNWRAWSWKRKLLDKVLLVFIVCGWMCFVLIPLYGAGFIIVPTIGLLAFLTSAGAMIAHMVQLSRFGWQRPFSQIRAASSEIV